MKRSVLILIGVLLLIPAAPAPQAQQSRLSASANDIAPGLTVLTPTPHAPVPRELSQLWLAPEPGAAARPGGVSSLNSAARLAADGDYSRALSLVSQPTAKDGPLGQYAAYYAGVVQ